MQQIHRPPNRSFLLIVLVTIALIAWGCAGTPGAAIPDAAGPAEPLFNGTDLTGWNGDPRFWSVENGVIVGETTEDNTLAQNSFLVWTGKPVGDFYLALEFRMSSSDGNSGVQYRSHTIGGWAVGGYQADMDAGNRYTGMLYEEGGRGILALRGQEVVIRADGEVDTVGSVGDPDELGAEIDMTDWNTYEIIARGNHLVHRVNGHITMDLTDREVEARADSGTIALQVHVGPPMRVEFRDIMLTRLSPATEGGAE